jgi:hypothetical protein
MTNIELGPGSSTMMTVPMKKVARSVIPNMILIAIE